MFTPIAYRALASSAVQGKICRSALMCLLVVYQMLLGPDLEACLRHSATTFADVPCCLQLGCGLRWSRFHFM